MRHGLYRASMLNTIPPVPWNQVVLAMHMDGTGTTYTDLKGSTVTAYGSVTQSSTTSMFGGISHRNLGAISGNELILSNLTTSTLLAYNGDFTVECWVYMVGDTEYNFGTLISRAHTSYRSDPALSAFELGVFYTGGLYKPAVNVFNTSAGQHQVSANLAVPLNTWRHVAVCRNGNTLRLWVHGALSGSTTVSGTVSIPSAGVQIGATNGRHSLNGYIDDLRVVHGLGVYTSPFTPPTTAFPNS